MVNKVLILIPTNKDKSYCIGRFIKNLKSIDLTNCDVLFSDDTLDNDEYKSIIESQGFEVVKVQKTIDKLNSGEKINIVQCLANARETLRNEFLKRVQYNYAVFFDSDILMPKNSVSQLISHKKDIVSGVYWQWKEKSKQLDVPDLKKKVNYKYSELYPVCFKYQENECEEIGINLFGSEVELNELFPCRLIGGSKDSIRFTAFGTGIFAISRKLMNDRWRFRYNPDKPETTEDMWFSIDIRELGYDIYIDSSVCCSHQMQQWKNKIKNKENQQ